jgi:hypothetical protein
MRRSAAVLLTVLALGALGACSDDDDPDPAASSSSKPTAKSSEPASPSAGTPSGSPGQASPGQVPRPEPGTCQPVAESPDGVYQVVDAGTVTLRLQDGGLSLDVRTTGGWSVSSNSSGGDADVEFRRGDEEIDFEADVEGGRLVLQVCDDDD